MRKQIRLTINAHPDTSTAALSAVRDALAATAREWMPNAEITADAEVLPDLPAPGRPGEPFRECDCEPGCIGQYCACVCHVAPAPSDLAAHAHASVSDAEWDRYCAAVAAAGGRRSCRSSARRSRAARSTRSRPWPASVRRPRPPA